MRVMSAAQEKPVLGCTKSASGEAYCGVANGATVQIGDSPQSQETGNPGQERQSRRGEIRRKITGKACINSGGAGRFFRYIGFHIWQSSG